MSSSTLSPGVIPRDKLKIWEIFRDVGPEGEEILKIAKLVHVTHNKKAYVVTTSDDTYSFLRTRFVPSVCKIAKIPQLCGVRVKDFAVSMIELAITEDGSLYSWIVHDPDVFDPALCDFPDLGPNDFAGLGRLDVEGGNEAKYDLVVTPNLVLGSLTGKKVDQLTLANVRVMALTVCGEVYQWGDAGTSWAPSLIPKQHFQSHEVISVACSDYISVALTSNGELFQWSLDNKVPKKVVVDDTAQFKKITSGGTLIFALTVNGALYSVRLVDSEPLWTRAIGEQAFQDIAASVMAEVVVFELKNNIRFAFGYQEENAYPPLSSFSHSCVSIDEFFGENSQATCRTFRAQSQHLKPGTLGDDIANLWESKENVDVTFSVEGKTISAHKFLLTSRSDYFAKMFSNEWNETKSRSGCIDIKDTKYKVFEALLFYLYHDKVNFGEDEYENIFGLMKLADAHCAVKIRQKCEQILMRNITSENAAFLVRNAASANASELETTVIRFILDNRLLELSSSPQELIDLLGMEAFQKISVAGLRRM